MRTARKFRQRQGDGMIGIHRSADARHPTPAARCASWSLTPRLSRARIRETVAREPVIALSLCQTPTERRRPRARPRTCGTAQRVVNTGFHVTRRRCRPSEGAASR
jgi:hypothetical protein